MVFSACSANDALNTVNQCVACHRFPSVVLDRKRGQIVERASVTAVCQQDHRDRNEFRVLVHDGHDSVASSPRQSRFEYEHIGSKAPKEIHALQAVSRRGGGEAALQQTEGVVGNQTLIRIGDEDARRSGLSGRRRASCGSGRCEVSSSERRISRDVERRDVSRQSVSQG